MGIFKQNFKLMEANERFYEAYKYLYSKGMVSSQSDLAERMGKRKSYISNAMKGVRGAPSRQFLNQFSRQFPGEFNTKWLTDEKGEMLIDNYVIRRQGSLFINQAVADNSPNAVVNASCNGNITVDDNGEIIRNHYDENTDVERKWSPVIPASMAKMSDFDIIEHITKQKVGNLEHLYSGTANIDIWHYIEDNELYPFYQKGDCLGLKAFERGDLRIKTGDVYVVDTKRDGFVVRRCRLNESGDVITYTFNDTDPQEFIIPKDDVIRIYRKVLMFRY